MVYDVFLIKNSRIHKYANELFDYKNEYRSYVYLL
jgi:hypothetical protein